MLNWSPLLPSTLDTVRRVKLKLIKLWSTPRGTIWEGNSLMTSSIAFSPAVMMLRVPVRYWSGLAWTLHPPIPASQPTPPSLCATLGQEIETFILHCIFTDIVCNCLAVPFADRTVKSIDCIWLVYKPHVSTTCQHAYYFYMYNKIKLTCREVTKEW